MRKQINFKDLRIKSLSLLAILVCVLAVTHFLQTTAFAGISRIVYSVIDPDKPGASLYVKSLNGISAPFTSLNQNNYDLSPTTSPDSSRVAFIRENLDGSTKLMIINANGTNETLIYQAEYLSDPTWSPDGNQLAFTLGNDTTFLGQIYNGCAGTPGQIASYNFDSKDLTVYGNTSFGTDPTWSPDLIGIPTLD